jgi:hypothetical protein
MDLTRDTVRVGGETPQVAPLLKIFDSSPLFEKSEILSAVRSANGEAFQVRANREKGK